MLKPARAGGILTSSEEQVIRNAIKTVVSGPRQGRNLEAFSSLLRGRIQAGEGDLTSRLESWIRPDQKGWLFNNRGGQVLAFADLRLRHDESAG